MENNTLKQKLVSTVVPVVAIVAIVVAGYFYTQVRALKQNPQAAAQQEMTDLIAKISRLIVLPIGETPTIATVSDPSLLKDQPFFVKAQKGDKVIIYAQAKKAILYSVLMDKIIDVAPLNIGQAPAVTPPTTGTTTTPSSTTKTPTKK